MNFLNRAVKNVTRKLSKSVLLAITFFVIGNFVIVGLGISNAAEQAKILTRQKMRAVITYQLDYEEYNEYIMSLSEEEQMEAYSSDNYPYITQTEIKELMADTRVKTFNALTTNILYSNGFESVPLNNEAENQDYGESCWIDEDGQQYCSTYVEPNLRVMMNSYPDMIEFADKMFILKEGRMYTQEDIDESAKVCLITDALAEHNNLRVGDMIRVDTMQESELNNPWYSEIGLTTEDFSVELEIIGIFDNMEELDPASPNFEWMSPYESPENIVLAPDTAFAEMEYNREMKYWDYYSQQYPDDEWYQNEENRPTMDRMMRKTSLTLLLEDPLMVDEFVEEYEALTEGQFRLLDANNETFKQLARPLDTLTLFASLIVGLVLINAVVIITLVTALTLKTREYEIGVLLSQGVSKLKIIAQFFVELAIVAVIGFTLSVGSGTLIAGRVGEEVLNYQVEFSGLNEMEEEDDGYYYWGNTNYFTEISLQDMVEEYSVDINPLIIGEIYVAGLGIVLISILIPSLMIMRFNPKRILMSAQ